MALRVTEVIILKRIILGSAGFALLLPAYLSAQKGTHTKPNAKQSFCVECEIKHSVKIPQEVLPLLTSNPADMRSCQDDNGSPKKANIDWFSGTYVKLNQYDTDLLVKTNSCMAGAHIGPFWILRKTKAGWRIIFRVRADGIEIENSMTNQNRDIKALFFNAVSQWSATLKFDGQEYR